LLRRAGDIEAQAERVLPHIVAALRGQASAAIVPCASQIGSGSLPVDLLSSAGIAISGEKRRGSLAEKVAAAFRALPIPVIGRIKDGAFLMDLRCLDDEPAFIAQLGKLALGREPKGQQR
jgi:L-seryl-tRNA(Ser) seleniumtransferase